MSHLSVTLFPCEFIIKHCGIWSLIRTRSFWALSESQIFLGLCGTCSKSLEETACIYFCLPADQNEIQLFSLSSLLWHITKLLGKASMLLSSCFLSNMFSNILSPLLLAHTLPDYTSADARDVSDRLDWSNHCQRDTKRSVHWEKWEEHLKRMTCSSSKCGSHLKLYQVYFCH